MKTVTTESLTDLALHSLQEEKKTMRVSVIWHVSKHQAQEPSQQYVLRGAFLW